MERASTINPAKGKDHLSYQDATKSSNPRMVYRSLEENSQGIEKWLSALSIGLNVIGPRLACQTKNLVLYGQDFDSTKDVRHLCDSVNTIIKGPSFLENALFICMATLLWKSPSELKNRRPMRGDIACCFVTS